MANTNFIYDEMMTHPALFTHSNPKKVVIIGDEDNSLLNEVIKHPNIAEIWQIQKQASKCEDPRVQIHTQEAAKWLEQFDSHFDVIITNTSVPLEKCFQALQGEGLLMQAPHDLAALKNVFEKVRAAGFRDVQTLYFPQSNPTAGWHMAWMATKRGVFRRVSEKTIFNKPFKTKYYNFDVHRAALAIPEFIREELNIGETS